MAASCHNSPKPAEVRSEAADRGTARLKVVPFDQTAKESTFSVFGQAVRQQERGSQRVLSTGNRHQSANVRLFTFAGGKVQAFERTRRVT